MINNIAIIDTTLREGNQCPGVRFSVKQSLEVASALIKSGINCVEIGHPFAAPLEFERVKAVAQLSPNFPLLAHARAKKSDIDAVKATGANWVGIFVGINESARKTRLNNRSIDQICDMIRESIQYAKVLGLKVRYTLEDASRTELSLALKAYTVACAAGADRICYSDSVGCDTPERLSSRIKALETIKSPQVAIEVHCHNDRGLAMANALAAIRAGATWISSSVNGIGERCGITDTITLMANLHYEFNYPLPKEGQLKKLSRLVSGISRQSISMQHPIVGVNAFKHTAKLHRDAVKKDMEAYAWINPHVLGEENIIDCIGLPDKLEAYLLNPKIISATELKYHRHGPGDRYVMLDNRFLKDCRSYCIIREVEQVEEQKKSHVDSHRHHVDSLFLFIGNEKQMTGLNVEVMLGEQWFPVQSPASVFIPGGIEHSYRFISGSGKFINFVLADNYNESLLEKEFAA
jgi:2-isopropylmalate synthase